MPASTGPNLGLNYAWALGENFKAGMDANLIALDALLFLSVISMSLTAPPGSPAEGDRYIVGSGATGAWAGQDGKVALYIAAAWAFYTPSVGWNVYNDADNTRYDYDGAAWVEGATGGGGGIAGVDVLDEGVTVVTDATAINFTGAGVSVSDVAGVPTVNISGGGGGSVAGSDKQIQFNDGGSMGADVDFTWDKTTNTLTLGIGSEFGTTTAYIRGANGLTAAYEGANLVIAPGDGQASGGGSGNITITTGKPGSSGANGTILIQPNQLPGASQNGGAVTVKGGDDSSGSPGSLTLAGGNSTSSGTGAVATLSGGSGSNGGGKVTVKGGDHSSSTNGITGAEVEIKGGTANRTSIAGTATGGPVNITGGAATGSTNAGNGGAVTVQGGPAAGTGNGGAVTVQGGVPTTGNGGDVSLKGSAGVGSNKNGGKAIVQGGAATGTGTPGSVELGTASLATTAVGGFPCIPVCSGAPTGTPANITAGFAPMVIDSTNNRLYFYVGGAWRYSALT